MLKMLLYGELADGTRQVGRPKLRFTDNLKTTLKSLQILVDVWELPQTDHHGAAWLVKEPSQLNSVAEP